jgi:threonine 3-dehydrogenase
MQALVKPGPRAGFELRTVPVPRPGPGDVLVRVDAVGICGTDLHIDEWDAWAASHVRPPRVIGHEFCGTVVEAAPDVRGIAVGDFVAGECHVNCGHCHLCRRGDGHLCESLKIIGVDLDGAFADYVVLPGRNAWKMWPEVPRDIAVIMDPFGNAVHTAFATDLSTRSVVVMGCGPIGLMALPIARRSGASPVIAVDVHDYRLRLAATMGADRVVDARSEDGTAVVRALTRGEGADVLLEFSGSPGGLHAGLTGLRNGGFAALLGLPHRPFPVDLANDVIFKGLRLEGIFGRRMWETWYQASALLAGGLDPRPAITHRLPMARYREAFDLMRSGRCGKVIVGVEEA